MAIKNEDIARVRDATDIVALIGSRTEIKRVGRQWMARCPLHGERTPSLSVSSEKGVYYCFGCQSSGDAITFVQETENLDFADAVEMLANKAGITLRYTRPEMKAFHKQKRTLREAVARARDFYHSILLSESDAGPARAYLRSRGYERDFVRRYRIGWAPDRGNRLCRHLKLTTPELRDCGLAVVGADGRPRDFFWNRLLFPIADERGDPVAFGGRLLPGCEGPKYVNTPSTAARIYDKSRVLYGLHEHRAEIVRQAEAVICEGYTDVIGSTRAGVGNTVATCGTALTEQHVLLLKRFSANRLVLAFDADAAGGAAAERVYGWERKHDLEVLVASLPDGTDPDDLARSDPQALHGAVNDAVPLLRFRVGRVLARHHMGTVDDRSRAAAEAAAVISEHPDAMTRDRYLIDLADRCQVDVRLLRQQIEPPSGRTASGTRSDVWHHRAAPGSARPLTTTGSTTDSTPEDETLRQVIHHPEEIADRLHSSLFADPIRREVFEALQAADSVTEAGDLLSPPAAHLLHRLSIDPGTASASAALAGLARLAVPRVLSELRRYASRTDDEDQRREYASCFAWLKKQSDLLSEPLSHDAALSQVMPWLIEYKQQTETGTQTDTGHQTDTRTQERAESRQSAAEESVEAVLPTDEAAEAVLPTDEAAVQASGVETRDSHGGSDSHASRDSYSGSDADGNATATV